MDAISILLTAVPLVTGVIFMAMSVADLKEMFENKVRSVLAPLWCFFAGLSWIVFGVVSVYGTTTDYLAPLSFLYFGLGFTFFPILFFATIILNVNLSGQEQKANEMRLE
jgi:uncharacterized membrane protein